MLVVVDSNTATVRDIGVPVETAENYVPEAVSKNRPYTLLPVATLVYEANYPSKSMNWKYT